MLWHWFGAMVWRNVQRTMLIDIAVMWPGVYALTALTLACSQQKKVGGDAACQCLHWPPFMSCNVLHFVTRAMTVSLRCCHRSISSMLCCLYMRTVFLQLWVLRHMTKDIVTTPRFQNRHLLSLTEKKTLVFVSKPHHASSTYRFCTCCFDNQLHIRALSFCGPVLFRSCIVIGPVTLGQAAAFFVVHRLESSTNSPRFVPWQLEVTCFDIGLAQWFGAMCKEPCSLTLQ